VNEVGRRIEGTVVNEMNKLPLAVKRLGKTGYPDIEISYQDLIAYLEMKTSSVANRIAAKITSITDPDRVTIWKMFIA
jgi:hypothetical protein